MHTTRALSICLGLALGLAATSSAWAKYQTQDMRIYVAPMASYTLFDDDDFHRTLSNPPDFTTGFAPKDQIGASLAIGKPLNKYLNLEAYGNYVPSVKSDISFNGSHYNTSKGDVWAAGVDALLFPFRNRFSPFAILGLGANEYSGFKNPDASTRPVGGLSNNADGSAYYYDAGVGFLFRLNYYGLAIRTEYRYRTTAVEVNHSRDMHLHNHIVSLGLQIPIGAPPPKPKPAPKPEPAAAAPPPPPAPKDSDGDGVNDPADNCPGTPPGTKVDANGCPVKKKTAIVLKGVTFKLDSAQLTSDATKRLDSVVSALQGSADVNVRIEGYTSNTGSAPYNLKLSKKRAASVKKYLVDHGISADRLTSKGFGETHPVASNDTDAGRAKNRRVELHIVK